MHLYYIENTYLNIYWMKKYNKPQIQPVLYKYKNDYNILTIGTVPSITLIQKKYK